MTLYQLAALFFRCLAILLFVNAVPLLWEAFQYIGYESSAVTGSLLPAMVVLLVGVLLWVQTPWFVGKITKKIDGVETEGAEWWDDGMGDEDAAMDREQAVRSSVAMPAEGEHRRAGINDLLPIGLGLMGIWLFAEAVIDAAPFLWVVMGGDPELFNPGSLNLFDRFAVGIRDGNSMLVAVVAKMVIGMFLFFRTDGIIAYWNRFRGPKITDAPVS